MSRSITLSDWYASAVRHAPHAHQKHDVRLCATGERMYVCHWARTGDWVDTGVFLAHQSIRVTGTTWHAFRWQRGTGRRRGDWLCLPPQPPTHPLWSAMLSACRLETTAPSTGPTGD